MKHALQTHGRVILVTFTLDSSSFQAPIPHSNITSKIPHSNNLLSGERMKYIQKINIPYTQRYTIFDLLLHMAIAKSTFSMGFFFSHTMLFVLNYKGFIRNRILYFFKCWGIDPFHNNCGTALLQDKLIHFVKDFLITGCIIFHQFESMSVCPAKEQHRNYREGVYWYEKEWLFLFNLFSMFLINRFDDFY